MQQFGCFCLKSLKVSVKVQYNGGQTFSEVAFQLINPQWFHEIFYLFHLRTPREETGSLQVENPLSRDWRLTDFNPTSTGHRQNQPRGTTSVARAPKPGKAPIMAARCRCRRSLLFFKIEVRPRPYRPYRVRRRCSPYMSVTWQQLVGIGLSFYKRLKTLPLQTDVSCSPQSTTNSETANILVIFWPIKLFLNCQICSNWTNVHTFQVGGIFFAFFTFSTVLINLTFDVIMHF